MSQLDLFTYPKVSKLPYSIMPNVIRSVGIPRHIYWTLKRGFEPRSVGVSDGVKELIEFCQFKDYRGKGLKFTYTNEGETLTAYLKKGFAVHISLYGKYASETGYKSIFPNTYSLYDAIEHMPEFLKNHQDQRLGFEKKNKLTNKKINYDNNN